MGSVGVHPPKTPVTTGSSGVAAATVPNVCKMPGPPAPFVPTPLPNIGRSALSPKGYTKKVLVEGKPVAVAGASFGSRGDIASKATGGGIVSSNTHGPVRFIGPGTLDVKFEGKNVHVLGEPMLNNCGPSGNPPNSATMMGLVQGVAVIYCLGKGDKNCPHPNIQRSSPDQDSKKRRKLEDKKTGETVKSDRLFRRAQALEKKGKTALATQMLDRAIEAEGQSRRFAFEQKVCKDTQAKEASVDYFCPDCGLQSEFDCVTKDGTIKEAKASHKAVSVSQFEGHIAAAKVLFPGAAVHVAVPLGQGADVTPDIPRSCIQEH